jgi:hypothetical protein
VTRTVGMSAFVEHACVSVVCTGCGDDYDGDRARHFESIPQALRYVLADGWVVGENTVLCVDCGEGVRAEELPAVVCEYCAPPLFADAQARPAPGRRTAPHRST